MQSAYFYASKKSGNIPLIVSLHTWSGDYNQYDPLAELVKKEDWNYIHPDFRGANDSPDACMSEAVIQDIDDVIKYAIENGNVDQNNIVVVGLSGGGMATLGIFLNSSYNLKYCMAWAPISDLEAWYYQSQYAGSEYWEDILKSTNSSSGLNNEDAHRRSPLYLIPSKNNLGSLEIYAGIHDGYTGSVSILHSILFYNKMAEYYGLHTGIISDKEIIMLLSRTLQADNTIEYLDKRRLIYKKSYRPIGLFIFDGTHEMLSNYAFNRIKTICSEE
jgi:hypothetical protein